MTISPTISALRVFIRLLFCDFARTFESQLEILICLAKEMTFQGCLFPWILPMDIDKENIAPAPKVIQEEDLIDYTNDVLTSREPVWKLGVSSLWIKNFAVFN
jgi:hypothetical protein